MPSKSRIKLFRALPILHWLSNYQKSWLKSDLSAGLTVGVMLIPQGMAYAMIAGLPPIYGLYASIIPLLLYAIFGTSRQLAVGPAAMVSLLVAAGVGAISVAGTAEYIQLVILLALMIGILQLLMGIFRLGFLVEFLSRPVITGFTSAAALIIGFSQLNHLLGIDIPRSSHIHKIIGQAISNIASLNFLTFLIGIGGIAILFFAKRWKLIIPSALLVVLLGIVIAWGFNLEEKGVEIVGTIPSGLPQFQIPILDMESFTTLLPIALTIALISFMESIAIAEHIQAKHKNYRIFPNQELIALGISKIGGAFFQALPTTGGLSRTAVNDRAGAKTGLASIFSAALITLTLVFLTTWFYYLPNAILASIIMVAVFGLIDLKEAKYLWKADRSDFWMMLVTFLCTLFLGIEEGIAIGAILSLGIIVYKTSRPDVIVLGKIPNLPHYRNIHRFKQVEVREDLLIVRFDARLYYANTSHFKQSIKKLVETKGSKLRVFILDADSINSIDSSGIYMLKDMIEEFTQEGITFYMVSVKGVVRDAFKRTGIFNLLGDNKMFLCVQNAIDFYDKKVNCAEEYYALQHNVKDED